MNKYDKALAEKKSFNVTYINNIACFNVENITDIISQIYPKDIPLESNSSDLNKTFFLDLDICTSANRFTIKPLYKIADINFD